MKKDKCALCAENKGKRVCRVHGNKTICSLCCAKFRNPDCEGCPRYAVATHYAGSKVDTPRTKHFIAAIKPEVDDAVNHALALVEKGNIEEGEAIISRLKKDNPRIHTVHYGMGVIHAIRGEHDEAIRCFDKSIDIFPYLLEAHFNKAVAYKGKFDIVNTVKAFKEVVAKGDPGDDLVKKAKRFIADMEESTIKTDGIDLDTYLKGGEEFDEAFSCMEKKEWEKAIAGFQACLSKSKRHVQSYGNMGLCYAQLGRREQALEALDKALELDPTYEPARINRMAVASLKEGENLERAECKTIEYYKDQFIKDQSLEKKSFVRSILEKIFKR